ncbi:MAG: Flp pilus assembly protein CpaB [Planctomycetaceae bacterium]|nr:Flp pilus assembly protein CpaB [Planctomycetaceae bacterium]
MRRLTPALLTLIMFGVVGVLVAAYVVKNALARTEGPAPNPSRNIPMPIADIPAGTVITENHLGQGPYPSDKLERDMLLVNRVIVGRVTKEAIKAAQPIRANHLYQPGEQPPLDLAEGMRAVSVAVGESTSMVDGLIKPGQYVDVLFTYQAAGNADDRFQGGVTMKLFDGVKILAINRSITQGRVDRQSNHVTLELTEAQSNIVVLAKDRGQITLTYNPNGKGTGGLVLNNTDRVTLYEILGLKRPEPDKEPFVTESYRGAGRGTLMFSDKGRRLDGWGGSGYGRAGFDYKTYFGAPQSDYSGSSNGRFGDDYRLPSGNGSSAPAAPAPSNNGGGVNAPSVERRVPNPMDTPVSRPDPTAARMIPVPN